MIKTLNSLDKGGNIIDLTGAADDYPLQVGETATITYTSATSVPLNVATVEGVYEILLSASQITSGSGMGYLKPNNIDHASSFTGENVYHQVGTSSVGFENSTSYSAFNGPSNCALNAVMYAFVYLQNKTFQYSGLECGSSTIYYSSRKTCRWVDTTTAWTSLGTIAFPFAQSGKIVIRRIA